jgi:hypothetical protein
MRISQKSGEYANTHYLRNPILLHYNEISDHNHGFFKTKLDVSTSLSIPDWDND